MTSFEEKNEISQKEKKNRLWIIIAALALAAVLGTACVGVSLKLSNKAKAEDGFYEDADGDFDLESEEDICSDTDENASDENLSENVDGNDGSTTGDGSTLVNNGKPSSDTESASGTQSAKGTAADTESSEEVIFGNQIGSTSSQSNNEDTKTQTTEAQTTRAQTAQSQTTQAQTTQAQTTAATRTDAVSTDAQVPSEAEYAYRDAEYGDDYYVHANISDAVVITEVVSPSANGVYTIPSEIGGKRVMAVMSLAFCNENVRDTVKKVIVPSSVKTIWDNAFANCYNLTDIYFCGNSIYTARNAFAQSSKRNGKLTIHCSASCSDRDFRYYKNTAPNYDAVYEEWND